MKTRAIHILPLMTGLFLATSAAHGQDWTNGGNTLAGNGYLGTNSNHAVLFETNNIERMRLDNGGFLMLNNTSANARMNIRHSWGNWLALQGTIDARRWTFHNNQTQDMMVFYYEPAVGAGVPMYSIRNDGKFTVGSVPSLPGDYKLYVQSGILTEKVKVALTNSADWADYVFQEGHTLLSLNEVRAYIAQHKHLPGVPSADEMVEQGVDVAKTDAMLLAKIEELTLYVLQLEERLSHVENPDDHK